MSAREALRSIYKMAEEFAGEDMDAELGMEGEDVRLTHFFNQ